MHRRRWSSPSRIASIRSAWATARPSSRGGRSRGALSRPPTRCRSRPRPRGSSDPTSGTPAGSPATGARSSRTPVRPCAPAIPLSGACAPGPLPTAQGACRRSRASRRASSTTPTGAARAGCGGTRPPTARRTSTSGRSCRPRRSACCVRGPTSPRATATSSRSTARPSATVRRSRTPTTSSTRRGTSRRRSPARRSTWSRSRRAGTAADRAVRRRAAACSSR